MGKAAFLALTLIECPSRDAHQPILLKMASRALNKNKTKTCLHKKKKKIKRRKNKRHMFTEKEEKKAEALRQY